MNIIVNVYVDKIGWDGNYPIATKLCQNYRQKKICRSSTEFKSIFDSKRSVQ